jgi:hypothetical protein
VREVAGVLRSSLLAGALTTAVFGTLAALLPRDLLGLCAFASLGLLGTYLALRAGERLFGLVLLPSLHRIKAL